jgi:tRNA dimethylallyltransferase
MISEVEQLLTRGVSRDTLVRLGLEYKYITLFLEGTLSLEYMHEKLATEIIRFAKRQMTFFRKMEREGLRISWLDPNAELHEHVQTIIDEQLWLAC